MTAKSRTPDVSGSSGSGPAGDTLARRIKLATAPAWLPPVGSTLTATVAGVKRGSGDYGDYPILIMEDADGGFHAVHAFHTMLRDRLAELRPGPGTILTVHYVGERQTNESKKLNDPNKVTTYYSYVVIPGDGTDDTDDRDNFVWPAEPATAST